MSVLSRPALESSPLADLHEIASELGLEGFRRLRKADLINAILGDAPEASEEVTDVLPGVDTDDASSDDEEEKPRRSRRGGRGRSRKVTSEDEGDQPTAEAPDEDEEEAPKPARTRSERPRRGRTRDAAPRDEDGDDEESSEIATGTVELLGNGSGFLRSEGDDDRSVYVSAAQVRRCELVDGDTVSGPVRPPRRSERHPSLVRVDTINGRPADEVAEGTRFEDLPAVFPTERFALGGEDATLKAIEWLTPLGRGSRATIVGAARSGKTEALRRLAAALSAVEELEVSVVLAGVRPEELADWKAAGIEPAGVVTLGAGSDVAAQAVDKALQTAKRLAARGGHAVLLIDQLNGSAPKALAAARNIDGGGSLTVIATTSSPVGGETTVIALDVALTSTGRFPALDLVASGTVKPELLVGDAGADAIAQARAAALGG